MEAKITFSRSPNCVVSPLGEKPCALDPASSGWRGDCDPTKPCPLTWEVGERVLRVACRGQVAVLVPVTRQGPFPGAGSKPQRLSRSQQKPLQCLW